MKKEWTKASLARTIDHTLLKAIATEKEVRELCAEARANVFASVCVNPYWVKFCAKELEGSNVLVCTVVAFPLGASTTEIKVEETKIAIAEGAKEIDMVINLGAVKAGNWKAVEDDIRRVVGAAGDAAVKVILEVCYLTEAEKIRACEVAEKAKARFVKTSTGFGTGGATLNDVRLMRKAVGDRLQVKASGGIRSYHDAILMLQEGADRIGASSSIAILSGLLE